MRPFHIALAAMVAAIWGFNFVVIKVGLQSFPPILLTSLRFAVAALAVFFLPRPALSWPQLIAIALPLFVGQYIFLFSGMTLGMPPGLASVLAQVQAFFTMLVAFFVLRERPGPRQLGGALIAVAGLALIAITVGGDVTLAGFVLTMLAAASWGTGNVLLKQAGQVDMLALIVWLSLIPPIPVLGLSLILDGPDVVWAALSHASWLGIGAVLYLAGPSTIIAFGVWAFLLKTYRAGTVAPFSLLVPVFGIASAVVLYGETFDFIRLFGMALIVAGVAVIALPWPLLGKLRSK